MSEKRRSAAEIIRYCKAATEGPWDGDHNPCDEYWAKQFPADEIFIECARTDLPAVTKAAVMLRRALRLALACGALVGFAAELKQQLERELDATAWLEDGDEG